MTNNSNIKGIEQGRAKFAYECAEKGKDSKKPKEYKSYSKKIPMYIKTNGLGSTFAFIKSKGGTYDLIYQQVTEWLKDEPKQLISDRLKNGEDLEAVIISLNSPEYRALTIEVLAFFNWLRRFADGLIEGDE